MDYVLKPLKTELSVTAIVNLHFFEFSKKFYTENAKHPFSELLYVESGAINVSSENYSGTLKKGEMIIHRPNELHALNCTENNEPHVIVMGFKCNSEELNAFSVKPFKLNENDVEKLARIVKEGRNVFAPPYDVPVYDMKEKNIKPFGAMHLLKILIEEFLITLIREIKFNETAQKENFRSSVSETIKYLDENFKEKISLDELAFLFGTNRATLCKFFKSNHGKTVGEYVNGKKIEYVKKLMLSTDKTLSEIADETHFESVHYFSTFFKKNTGYSPSEYRKKFFNK